jgi:hypothetical protein
LADGWFVEEGIAEHRAILLQGGAIIAARIAWPGRLAAGKIADAVLTSRTSGSSRGTVRFAGGEDALVDRLPQDASEGAVLRVEVLREAIAQRERLGLKSVWTQLDIRDDAVAAEAEAAGLKVVMDRCPAIEYRRLGL